eukprot:TRINITY_DN8395_c0_g1_i1.p1 TRINITY_DN8395_c0_g1~~TRINITY_DN8395_c0_g1_i1.p1  ORF type:complete len:434 (-),score=117.37 TRINITY_DN8395_c0_g1_i1:70-1371(-)
MLDKSTSCASTSSLFSLKMRKAGSRLSVAPHQPKDTDGQTPLHIACYEGRINDVKNLLKRKADVNAVDKNEWTPLFSAVYGGHLEIVKKLLGEKDLDVMALNRDGDSILHSLVKMNLEELHQPSSLDERRRLFISTMKTMIKKGAPTYMSNKHGDTVLHKACTTGNILAVGHLLHNNICDLEALNKLGETPLNTAKRMKREDVVRLLARYGAEENTQGPVYESALQNPQDSRQNSAQPDTTQYKTQPVPKHINPIPKQIRSNPVTAPTYHVAPKLNQVSPSILGSMNSMPGFFGGDDIDQDKIPNTSDDDVDRRVAIQNLIDEISHPAVNINAAARGTNAYHRMAKLPNKDATQVWKICMLHLIPELLNQRDEYGNTPFHIAAHNINQQLFFGMHTEGADPTIPNDQGLTPYQIICQRSGFEVNDEYSRALKK